VIVFALEFARLEQLFELVSGTQCLLFSLYVAGLEQSHVPVSGVPRLLFACISQVWSKHSFLSVEFGDCYSLVCCRSGATI
jgi:hypothetical protein